MKEDVILFLPGKWVDQDIDENRTFQPHDFYTFTSNSFEYFGSNRKVQHQNDYRIEIQNDLMTIVVNEKALIQVYVMNEIYALTKIAGVFHVWKKEY